KIVDVYFDDLKIVYRHSPVIQNADFYMFGLEHATAYQKPNSTLQRWKFQGQEHISAMNLRWVQFKWRNAMPDIGRFFNVDPLSEKYVHNSTYAFSENRVVNGVELEGVGYFNTTSRVGFSISGN